MMSCQSVLITLDHYFTMCAVCAAFTFFSQRILWAPAKQLFIMPSQHIKSITCFVYLFKGRKRHFLESEPLGRILHWKCLEASGSPEFIRDSLINFVQPDQCDLDFSWRMEDQQFFLNSMARRERTPDRTPSERSWSLCLEAAASQQRNT